MILVISGAGCATTPEPEPEPVANGVWFALLDAQPGQGFISGADLVPRPDASRTFLIVDDATSVAAPGLE